MRNFKAVLNRLIGFVVSVGFLLAVSVSCFQASAEEQDPVEDIPVPMSVDPVEPGSPEAFFTWVTSTLELIDDSLSSSNLGGWGLSTVEYAMEMRSLMIAYQVWLDNDTLQANMVVPSWASVSGFCRVSDSGVFNGYSLHRVTATYAINGSSDTVAMYHMPGGISVFSSDIGFARTLNTGVETEHRSFLPYAALSDPWIDGAQRHALTVVMLGFVASTIDTTPFMQVGNNYSIDFFDWADIPSHWVYLRGNGLSSFACQSGSPIPQSILGDNVKVPIEIRTNDDLPRLFDEINEEYPDHEDIFPDMIPPKHNYEYDEPIEDTSHPCGCQCEIHIIVDVNHDDFEFPTYNVTDVPEPSDFDFNMLETVDPSDQPSLDFQSIPEDILHGTSFWFQLMDYTVDLFHVKSLVIMLLGLAFLLFLIVR